MPRTKSKGTRQSSIIARRKRGQLSARLVFWGRRIIVVTVALFLTGWFGTWVYLSGAPQRGIENIIGAGIEKSADAGFALNGLLVEGRVHTDPDMIRAIVGLEKGDPLLSFDPQKTSEILSDIPWIKSVHVARRLPSVIYIEIEEYEPAALWQDGKDISVISVNGRILSQELKAEFKELPIISGKNGRNALEAFYHLIKAEPVLFSRLDRARYISERRWDITLSSGVNIKLPEDDLALALRALVRQHEDNGLLDKSLEEIDMRVTGRITVKTKPGEVQEYKASFTQNGSGERI